MRGAVGVTRARLYDEEPLDPRGDEDKDGIKNLADTAPLIGEDKDGFQDSDGIPDPDEARLDIKEELHFDEDSSELNVERSNLALDALRKRLTDSPFRIEIRGHTDNRCNPEQNRKLSQARAESVRGHLTAGKVWSAFTDAAGHALELEAPRGRMKAKAADFQAGARDTDNSVAVYDGKVAVAEAHVRRGGSGRADRGRRPYQAARATDRA